MNAHRDLLRAARANAREAVRLHRAGDTCLASALLHCARDQINRAKAARIGAAVMRGMR
jgi:hypothetical protein